MATDHEQPTPPAETESTEGVARPRPLKAEGSDEKRTTTANMRSMFMAFVQGDADKECAREFTVRQGFIASRIESGTIRDAVAFLRNNRSPLFLLVDVADKDTVIKDLDALADVCEPDVKVILCGEVNDLQFYFKVMEFGISEYILKPLNQDVLERAFVKASSGAADERAPAKVIAVLGSRGGIGTSTIASTLAYILANKHMLSTTLVDLDPQLGTASLDLDLEPSRGLRDALEKPDRIDSLFMDRVLVRSNDWLSIISAEEALEEEVNYHENAIQTLISELQPKVKFIIVDVPRVIRKPVLQLLSKADKAVIVSELSIAGLRDTLRYNELLTLLRKPSKIVINRVGMTKKHQMPLAQFEKSLKRKVDYSIPFDASVFGFANTGKPLAALSEKNKVFAVLQTLAVDVADRKDDLPAKPGKLSLFGGKAKKPAHVREKKLG